jgi:hypothetical protein
MKIRSFLYLCLAFAFVLAAGPAGSAGRAAAQSSLFIVEPLSGLQTTRSGGQDFFTVAISTRPESAVQVDLSSSRPEEGTVSPKKLVFNPGNWSAPETVTVTGLGGGTADGDQAYTIHLAPAKSNDSRFDGQDPPDVSVTNLDVDSGTLTAPKANDDSDITLQGVPVTTNVLANDLDIEGRPHSLTVTRQPGNGTAETTADDRITYTPEPSFAGQDSYDYEVCNPGGQCSQARVTVLVEAENRPPTAVDDEYTTAANTSLAMPVMSNDFDEDGDTLYLASFDLITSQGGLVTRIDNGTLLDTSDDELFYLPPLNFDGSDTFTYTVSDGELSDSATVKVFVGISQNAPIANDDSYTVEPGTALEVTSAAGVLANDEDVNGTGLSAVLVSGPAAGTLELEPDGSFRYTPEDGFEGEDAFTYKADDGSAESSEATVTITVTSIDYAPVAADDSYTTGQLETLEVPPPGLLENDADANGEDLSAELVAGPAHGSLTLNEDGSFTYQPDPDYVGADSFRYRTRAGSQTSNEATVSIEVLDQLPPDLAWVQPILDGGVLNVGDRPIRLQLDVDDNVAVQRVEIFRWDAVDEEFVDIVTLEKEPYEYELDARVLNMDWNQVFAIAYDAAGNRSERQFIWLYRTVQELLFLPLLHR